MYKKGKKMKKRGGGNAAASEITKGATGASSSNTEQRNKNKRNKKNKKTKKSGEVKKRKSKSEDEDAESAPEDDAEGSPKASPVEEKDEKKYVKNRKSNKHNRNKKNKKTKKSGAYAFVETDEITAEPSTFFSASDTIRRLNNEEENREKAPPVPVDTRFKYGGRYNRQRQNYFLSGAVESKGMANIHRFKGVIGENTEQLKHRAGADPAMNRLAKDQEFYGQQPQRLNSAVLGVDVVRL